MIIKIVNKDCIHLEPEDVAEIELLKAFEGGTISLEEAQPFSTNRPVLVLEKQGEAD